MAINEWWAGDPTQRYWMEITDRQDLGGQLQAPHIADDGRPKWGYELVRFVKPGDVILHWYTRRSRRLIGFSVVAGPPESKEMVHQSRGTSGRAHPSAAEPEPAWTAPLRDLTHFPVPVTRQNLQLLRTAVLEVEARLAETYAGTSLYFPFYEYGGRELRATQAYLAKFPAQLIPVLGLNQVPGLAAAGQGRPQAAQTATLEEVLNAVQNLHPQEAEGLPKRHQPLTLLWAIGQARQEQDRLAPWPTVRPKIEKLIRDFGHSTDRPNAYLPFLALAHTDLWELTADPPPKGTGPDARREWLTNAKPAIEGGLTQRVYNLMASSTGAAAAVVAELLGTYFEGVDSDNLLQAAGLGDLAGDVHGLREKRAAQALISALAESTVIAAEAANVERTEYARTPGTVIVRRGEAQLVARYLQTLPPDKAIRLQLTVGLTDLYDEEAADIIEAKVSAEHRYVRQALGQLLDYAAHCTQPLNRLTALFPAAPSPTDVALLHVYGIDCLYWAGGDDFPRREAPAEARQRIAAAWSSLARPSPG